MIIYTEMKEVKGKFFFFFFVLMVLAVLKKITPKK